MATEIPTFVTHYHLTDKPPFLNLSDLADPELSVVIQELQQRRASSGRTCRHSKPVKTGAISHALSPCPASRSIGGVVGVILRGV